VDAKKRWLEDPASFASQIKLKLGKPGVLPIGLYKETVSTDFSVLLDDIDKRSSDDFTTNNNGVLIRYQILRFYEHVVTKVNAAKVYKRNGKNSSMQPPTKKQKKVSPAVASDPIEAAHGFLNLSQLQSQNKEPPPVDREALTAQILDFVKGGRDSAITEDPAATEEPPGGSNDESNGSNGSIGAIEDDLGPFSLAGDTEVSKLKPVLLILPESGDVNVVIIELSPLDVYYRHKLRVDRHAMTYLDKIPSFDQLCAQGCNFQFFSASKDHVSDSFGILRGARNKIVTKVMDNLLPDSIQYQLYTSSFSVTLENTSLIETRRTRLAARGCRISIGHRGLRS
jgi:hypothetical protein